MRMMIAIRFAAEQLGEMAALLPKEQEHVRELMGQGVIESIYISANRTLVWMVMKGESEGQIEQELRGFPLYSYMKFEATALL